MNLSPQTLPKQRRGTGPNRKRKTSLDDEIRGKRTRKLSIFEHEMRFVFLAAQSPSKWHMPRTWHSRNIGELLLATGWKSLVERSIWCNLPERSERVPLADLFAVESPLAYAWIADKFQFDIVRLYPIRIEMPDCTKAHRAAVLDIAAENRYRPESTVPYLFYEIIVERLCGCFHDGTRDHEGSVFGYRWR